MQNNINSIYKSVFYGTGAAEGIPNPFCKCNMCEYARKYGGKNIRKRSAFRVSDNMMIDMGPDIFHQSIQYGDLTKIQHILVTHTHEDHFSSDVIALLKMATNRLQQTVHIYLTGKAYDIVELLRESKLVLKGGIKKLEENKTIVFHKLDYEQQYEIDDMKVIPLKGHHFGNMGENSANYLLIFPNGKKLYYGTDTGMYEDCTFSYLENQKIDTYVSECTYGNVEDDYPDPGHLSHTTCMQVISRLIEIQALTEKTNMYFTHINHIGTADHEALQKLFDSQNDGYKMTVAYDGLEIYI